LKKIPKKNKRILGIDPGSTTVGYGVIEYSKRGNNPNTLGYGYIDLKKQAGNGNRLLHLYKDIKELFEIYSPDSIAIENIFFFKNAKTISAVLQSKGVILLAAAEEKINIHEYSPLQVKQAISGYGKANKLLVGKMIQSILGIKTKIRPDDASDALAIAICHMRHLTVF
jgi:crossover junction endodeoxyribonuclease RuvC